MQWCLYCFNEISAVSLTYVSEWRGTAVQSTELSSLLCFRFSYFYIWSELSFEAASHRIAVFEWLFARNGYHGWLIFFLNFRFVWRRSIMKMSVRLSTISLRSSHPIAYPSLIHICAPRPIVDEKTGVPIRTCIACDLYNNHCWLPASISNSLHPRFLSPAGEC